MNTQRSISAPIATEEREERFQRIFIKKIQEEKQNTDGGNGFPRPYHLLGSNITKDAVFRIPSTHKVSTGVNLIYFPSAKAPLLITTTGIFFLPVRNKGEKFVDGFVSWLEMDFIASQNLMYDDFSFVVKKFTLQKTRDTIGVLVFILGVIIWALVFLVVNSFSPSASRIVSLVSFVVMLSIAGPKLAEFMTSLYFRDKHNLIYIRPRHSGAYLGRPIRGAEDIIVCMKLALEIFRLQRAKYGDQS